MDLTKYYNHPEVMVQERRVRVCFTLAKSLKNYLKYMLDAINAEDYNMSYLIEDLIYLVVSDENLLKRFIQENIELEPGEGIAIHDPPDELKQTIDELAKQINESEEEYS